MDTFELFEILIQTGQKLDSLWEFFVTIHVAIIGALFIFHQMIFSQKIITTFAYLTFTGINLRAKIEEYELYVASLKDLKGLDLSGTAHLAEFVSQYELNDRIMISWLVHGISLLILLYLVWYSPSEN